MKASLRDNLIRLGALAITMIPYRWGKEGETMVYRSLLFRYEYNQLNKPALKVQRNKSNQEKKL